MANEPFVDWYEVWLAQHGRRAKAEAADKASLEREIRWMARIIVGWALIVTGTTVFAIWRLLLTY